MRKGIDYILISELPNEDQEPFRKWLFGKTRPIVEVEGVNSMDCCYKLDYERWRAFHKIQEYGSECVQYEESRPSIPEKDDEKLKDKCDSNWNLTELLKNVNDENTHSETKTGDSVGEEDW